jgi:DMSO/TMAO reductase YedYZ molybdopterin-dependent catalytic subunit
MGNARWTGVTLKTLLDRVGVRTGAIQVRFRGLDVGETPETPVFMKSLAIDHAMDGEVIIAYGMNGVQLPLLNGFPLRLIVPGWYSTYWVKMLGHVEVLDKPDDNFWMRTAYLIPDTPGANMQPSQQGVRMAPINRMVPRSFITNLQDNQVVRSGQAAEVRGIAFGGDTGLRKVAFSNDGGKTWQDTSLETDYGPYSFRRWRTAFTPPRHGSYRLMVSSTNRNGLSQPVI